MEQLFSFLIFLFFKRTGKTGFLFRIQDIMYIYMYVCMYCSSKREKKQGRLRVFPFAFSDKHRTIRKKKKHRKNRKFRGKSCSI